MKMKLCLVFMAMLVFIGNSKASTVTVKSDRDLGLYGITASDDGTGTAIPGIFGTQRGKGGRMDVNGTSTGVGNVGGPNEGMLLSFDLSSLVPAGQSIVGASLELRLAGVGIGWDADVAAYPVNGAWQEGNGSSSGDPGNPSGDTGFPWGPAAQGDSTASFRSVSTVLSGTGPFAATDVATDGTAWDTPFGRGIGTDLLADKLIESRVTGSTDGSGPGEELGDVFASIPLTAAGLNVLNGWADGSVTNNGFNVFFENDYGDPRTGVNGSSSWRVSSRELNVFGFSAGDVAPTLVLEIVPEPSCVLLLGVGLVGMTLAGRRR